MTTVRLAASDSVTTMTPCSQCAQADARWDQIFGQAYCPSCEEQLIQGEGEPVVLHTERHRCAICAGLGTVRYVTFPLNAGRPVEMDLCAAHLRALLARNLGPSAFHQLRRQLRSLGLDVGEIFLLHEAFYDSQGCALQPAIE
jgi:hypothetical protein